MATENADKYFAIWKLDSLGNVLWSKIYSNPGFDRCLGGTVDEFGNIYISGSNGYYPNEEGLVIKTDQQGVMLWRKQFNQCAGINISSFLGSLWFHSSVHGSAGINDRTKYFGRVDYQGTIIWDSVYTNLTYSSPSSPPLLVGDKIYLASSTYDSIWKGNLVLSDTLGQIQFSRFYQNANSNVHYVNDICPTNNGDLVLVGRSGNTPSDSWVLRVDSLGCLVANCALDVLDFIDSKAISCWPNPTKDVLNVSLMHPTASGLKKIYVIDAFGVVQLESEIDSTDSNIEVTLNGLSSGIYYLFIRNENGEMFTEKIVKQ